MRNPKTSKAVRIAAGALCVMLLVVVLFSAFYIAAEADHDCCGEGCRICVCLHHCRSILHQFGIGRAARYAAVVPVFAVLIAAVFAFTAFCRETPVTGKVRLNN